MAETWSKRQREQKKRNAKMAKMERRLERKESNLKGKGLNAMLAYVDEYGNLSETPPDVRANSFNRPAPVAGTGRGLDDGRQQRGIVIFFDDNRGYGFIKNAQARESIFVHANSSAVELEENLKVTFEVQKGPKGLMAVNVRADR